jgi:hypothetical protein
MNHQPYKNWLLSEETLTPEQTRSLQAHLSTCQTCRQVQSSWMDVQRLFETAPQVAPADGFAGRWKVRLAAEKRKKQRRNAWIFFGVTASIALLLLALLCMQALQAFQSPAQLYLFWIYRLASVMTVVETVEGIFLLALQVVPQVSLVQLVFFTGFASLVSVLWFVAFQKLTYSRRIVQ